MMRLAVLPLLLLALIVLPVAAVTAAQHRAKAPDTKTLIASLNDVTEKVQGEQDVLKSLAGKLEKECKAQLGEHGAPKKAIRDGERLIQRATSELEDINADRAAVESAIRGLKTKMSDAKRNVDELTGKLKALRSEQKKGETQVVATLQQLDSVIAETEWHEEHHRRHGTEPSKLNTEVSDLKRLGRQLSASAVPSAPAFLQTQAARRGASAGKSVGALKADRRELLRARKAATTGFQEEEARLIDLIKVQREELQKLESALEEQQPVLADKFKQSSETNRSIAMASRVMARDTEALDMTKVVCDLQSEAAEQMLTLRGNLLGLLKMPGVLLANMDTAMFLQRDLNDLKVSPPSFVQLRATAKRSGLAQAVQDALRAAAGAAEVSLGASADSADSEGDSDISASAMLQQGTSGPFDKVTGMIRSLIANLRDQANEDTNLHQWCMDSSAENDKNRIETKSAQNEAEAQILWAKSAMAKLGDQVSFFQDEITRLQKQEQDIRSSISAQEKLTKESLGAHKQHQGVLVNIVNVLQSACDLDVSAELNAAVKTSSSTITLPQVDKTAVMSKPSAHVVSAASVAQVNAASSFAKSAVLNDLASFGVNLEVGAPALLQMKTESSTGIAAARVLQGGLLQHQITKKGQCAEAASIIVKAISKMGEVDVVTSSYINSYKKKAGSQADAAKAAFDQRSSDLIAAKAAKSKRAHELAVAEGDKKQLAKDLELVEEAARSIEQKCSVKETHEERMARRQDEMDALKSALKVMSGEEIPVESSFVTTGAVATHRVPA